MRARFSSSDEKDSTCRGSKTIKNGKNIDSRNVLGRFYKKAVFNNFTVPIVFLFDSWKSVFLDKS